MAKSKKKNKKAALIFSKENIEIVNRKFFENVEDIPQILKTRTKESKLNEHNLAHGLLGSGFCTYTLKDSTINASENFFKMLGLSGVKKIDESKLREIINPADNEDLITAVKNLPSIDEQGCEVKALIINQLGQKETKYFKVNFSLLKKNIILASILDISEHYRWNEDLIKAKERAEAADSLKTTFLTNFSHEIRTPMNSILGFTELLNIGEHTPEQKAEYLSIIKIKSKELLGLIDDIVELAKFESGEITITKTETNLAKLLSDLQQEFYNEKERLKKNQVELFLSLPADNTYNTIYTDTGRLHQVISYLLDNAIKYTEKGYVQFGYEVKDNKHLIIFVKDTGIGISKDKQKYLFTKLKYKEETIVYRDMEKGLSLTIARAIVEALGGRIYVESTQDEGSYFYFTIPIVKSIAANTTETNHKLDTPNWKNKIILVAEDEEMNFKFIEAILFNTQAQLIHVQDGQQAVELCKSLSKIDLILMDIKMPEMNGYDAVREIKKIRNNVPIIAQTAYTFKEERSRCIDAGCNDYISKPIDVNLLIQKINRFFVD